MERSPFGRYCGIRNELYTGVKWVFTFENTYGASVIKHAYSYGGIEGFWELAVLDKEGELDYKTGITDDVIGWLTESAVENLLDRISKLSLPIETTSTEVKGILE